MKSPRKIGNKTVIILGPTASGKSELAVKIARKFNGEVISADSRQVYRGLNIGSGKIARKEMMSIPHHLLDVASPKRKFTVAQYQKLARRAIEKILAKDKLPIICGGTGFYIQSIVDGIIIPEVRPNWKLRKKLGKETIKNLFTRLKKLDPKRARAIDSKNKRRLIRALEIIIKTRKPIQAIKNNPLPYPLLILGIKKEKEELKKLIRARLVKRLKQGMIKEVSNLKKSGLSFKRLGEFGLEYKQSARFLQGEINREEMIQILQREIEHFAKRQMTWFKRDKRIKWVKNPDEAKRLVLKFIKKKGSKEP